MKLLFFYFHRLLTQTGWKVIRRIECPLFTQRLISTQVQHMQTKRILGTIGRTLLTARPEPPGEIRLIHGEPNAQTALAKKLNV